MPCRVRLGKEGGLKKRPGKEYGEMGPEKESLSIDAPPAYAAGKAQVPLGLGGRGPGVSFCVGCDWARIEEKEEEEEASVKLRSHNSQGVTQLLCGAHLSPTSSGFMQLPCLLGALPPNSNHGIIYSC